MKRTRSRSPIRISINDTNNDDNYKDKNIAMNKFGYILHIFTTILIILFIFWCWDKIYHFFIYLIFRLIY